MCRRSRQSFSCAAIALLTASACSAAPNRFKRNDQDGQIYVRITPGAYSNGCSLGDAVCFDWELPARTVTIARGFWIGQTEATQRAYERVMGANPSLYRGPDLPVDQISWTDAKRFCEAIGMRLPSEIEWEYAARGGSAGPRYGPLESIARYDANSGDMTHKVASKMPNAFGIYDMLGNVWEWVEDAYDRSGKPMRLLRGGSFFNLARDLRVSNRLWAPPETAHRNMGVRCAGD